MSMEHGPLPSTDLVPLRVLSHLILTSEEIPQGESPVIIPILQTRNQRLIDVQGLAQVMVMGPGVGGNLTIFA